ncbi:MAG: CDP-diacylglycerol--serine O-phosphatidyltransferase [Deltaproteobacteria bacterium]|nr:CDP-diacylglycerol--serine O-phosphatidyltransferase [Deltaproteobacteria bacterium]
MDTLKKGVYILPNFMTSMSLLCGFYAVVSTMKGDFVRAAWVIILAAVFDGLDGRIARMTNTTSKFGMEYDSLADLVAFGVAPAVLAYGLVLNQYGRWGWLAAFLYVACGAIRLARFNVMASTESSSFFQGLPIPAAAGMIASTIVFCFHFDIVDRMLLGICFMLMMYAEAFLMVSSVRFKSFKDLDLKSRKPFSAVVVIILLICVVASEPQIMLFVIGLAYLCSGPLEYAVRRFKKEKQEDANVLHAEDENGWKQKE